MINTTLNNEILEIINKIYKGMDIEYQGNFINGDYMFNIAFTGYDWFWEDVTIKKNKCVDEKDALIYLVVTTFIDCINICKEYPNINTESIESFNKWLNIIGHEDANNLEEIQCIMDEDCDIYNDFLTGLDKAKFARNILTKEELFMFGDFVKNNDRYKHIVAAKVSTTNKKLAKAKR